MPPSSRIPPLLQPYTQLPDANSILLLTSTLGASANWLIVRFLCDALTTEARGEGISHRDGDGGKEEVNVILVSWMRDWDFWKQESRKGGGLDLERLRDGGRVAFVDGLGGLFLPQIEKKDGPEGVTRVSGVAARSTGTPAAAARAPHILPVRGPPGRIPAPARTTASAAPVASLSSANEITAPRPQSRPGHYTLPDPSLKTLQSTVQTALSHFSAQRKTLLVLDAPDALLATTSLPPSSLTSTILTLHTQVSHILVHIHADDALLAPSTPPQPLEVDGHNFLVKTAHMSQRILSCRVLDTGVARDVSGVLRVTDNGRRGLEVREERDEEGGQGNRELLYFVKGDGSVRVFERGAGG